MNDTINNSNANEHIMILDSGKCLVRGENAHKVCTTVNIENMEALTELLVKHDELIKQVTANLARIREMSPYYNFTIS